MPNIFIQQMLINLKGGIELSSQPGPFVFLFSSFFWGVVVMPKGPCNGIFGGLLSLLSRPGPARTIRSLCWDGRRTSLRLSITVAPAQTLTDKEYQQV
jgi:hypothetical protein